MTDIALNESTVTEASTAGYRDQSPSLYQVTREVFAERLAKYGPDVFIVANDVVPIQPFLSGLPIGAQREYTCNTCAKFMKDAGSFVFIKDDGTLISAMWDHTRVPEFYREAIQALQTKAENGTVVNVFRPRDFDEYTKGGNLKTQFSGLFGAEEKGGFNHFSIQLPAALLLHASGYKGTPKTRHELLYQNFYRTADLATLNTTLAMFKTGKLYRAEQYVPWVEWLIEIRTFIDATKNQKLVSNYLAKKAITAPAGWVEFRESMVGKLMENLKAAAQDETTIGAVIGEFNRQADPVNYQRAKAEATEGNIRAAQKFIEKMGMEKSFARRWARFDELVPFARWLPKQKVDETSQAAASGIFADLLTKVQKKEEKPKVLDVNLPTAQIPLFRFLRDVLPTAHSLQVYLGAKVNIGGTTTAVHEDAPALMRWDKPERRNPFCQFVLVGAVAPQHFGLQANAWHNVRGVIGTPKNFHDPEAQAKDSYVLLEIEGVQKFDVPNSAIFKETVIGELHEFGPTLESYSKSTPLQDVSVEDKAVHIAIHVGTRIRVTSGDITTVYELTDLSL